MKTLLSFRDRLGLERGWGRGEDLGGDEGGLRGVVGADLAGHEEAVDEAEDGGDAGPAEEQVPDAGGVAADIELVDAEAAEEEGEEEADELFLAGAFVFGVEPGALLGVHLVEIGGIGHGVYGVACHDTKFKRGWFQGCGR